MEVGGTACNSIQYCHIKDIHKERKEEKVEGH